MHRQEEKQVRVQARDIPRADADADEWLMEGKIHDMCLCKKQVYV
jgi:hypothetical protein